MAAPPKGQESAPRRCNAAPRCRSRCSAQGFREMSRGRYGSVTSLCAAPPAATDSADSPSAPSRLAVQRGPGLALGSAPQVHLSRMCGEVEGSKHTVNFLESHPES
jgi:hypothetical protein